MSKNTIVDKMDGYINELDQKKRNVKVLVIAFMAHGVDEDRIVFSDKQTCKYKTLLQPIFDCESLRGVPKIIINQFCRGEFNMNTAFADGLTNENVDRRRLINGQADLLQCFATAEGNVAVRQKDGSPFIKELCSLLKECVSMMIVVQTGISAVFSHWILRKRQKLIGWGSSSLY